MTDKYAEKAEAARRGRNQQEPAGSNHFLGRRVLGTNHVVARLAADHPLAVVCSAAGNLVIPLMHRRHFNAPQATEVDALLQALFDELPLASHGLSIATGSATATRRRSDELHIVNIGLRNTGTFTYDEKQRERAEVTRASGLGVPERGFRIRVAETPNHTAACEVIETLKAEPRLLHTRLKLAPVEHCTIPTKQ